jgi:predicted transcriptional regulator
VRLPPELLARVDGLAQQASVSRATSIRRLIASALGAENDGVDVAQIRRALALSPAERVRTMVEAKRNVAAVRSRAVR